MDMFKSETLKGTILRLFIPLIVVFVVLTGFGSYKLAAVQMEENASTSIQDTVSQTERFLNDKLTDLIYDLTTLDNDSELNEVFNRLDEAGAEMEPNDYRIVSKSLDKSFLNRSGILNSIILYYNNGKIAFRKQDGITQKIDLNLNMYRELLVHDNPSVIQWLNLHPMNMLEDTKATEVVSLYKLLGSQRNDPKGILLFHLNSSFFQEIIGNPEVNKNGYISLVSPDGVMRFKDVHQPFQLSDQALQQALLGREASTGRFNMVNDRGQRMLVIYETLPINKWKVAAVVPEYELLQRVNYIKYVTVIVMVIFIAAAILLSNFLANIITKPIIQLARKLNHIEQGNLEIQFQQHPNQEIAILNRGIGDMLERIKELVSQVGEAETQKRNAEMLALQAQIQPHFLYNTLYSIKQLCELGEVKDASRMVTALAGFFRSSINNGPEQITVAQEIQHIEHYLLIQGIRYGEDFAYEIDIDPRLLDYPIVKLTLQPLIENAIYHGMKEIRTKGILHIRGIYNETGCYIDVEDNGAGMTAEKLQLLRCSLEGAQDQAGAGGVGVRNVHRRLQLHFGSQYGLQYESHPGEGTRVRVNLGAR